MVAVQSPVISDRTEVDTLKKQILIALLANKNLSLISIWSPTILMILCDFFMSNYDDILNSLACSELPGAKNRAHEIRGIDLSAMTFKAIWPHFILVSCWADGPSEIHAKKLQSYFPGVAVQGKGLLSTEAFISFPFLAGKDPVLASNSHFFEFLSSDGVSHLANEVEKDETYSVVVTNITGLLNI